MLASQALYEIAKVRIQQKDFYEAHHNLKRASAFKLKMKKLNNYRIFTEGVIFLMKRKTKTGVKMITSLVERIGKATANNLENNNQHNSLADPKENSLLSSDFIYDLVFLYRAYGHFMLEDYDLSLKDYIKSN